MAMAEVELVVAVEWEVMEMAMTGDLATATTSLADPSTGSSY